MEIERTNATVMKFTGGVYSNCYVSSYAKSVEIDFSESDSDGVGQKIELHMPIEKARSLAEELVQDLESYDKQVAEQKAELEAERLEAEAQAEAEEA
jgi:hypothetical protein|tara:strand:+ start:200 stop:490 length:291 start_codon:yes stop_codon:yes gene_type:complete